MKKKYLIMLSSIMLLSGCSNNSETDSIINDSASNSDTNTSTSTPQPASDSESSVDPVNPNAYKTVYSANEIIYVYGSVGQEPFDLKDIDTSLLTKNALNYTPSNDNIEISTDGKVSFKKAGYTIVTATNSQLNLKYCFVVKDSDKAHFEYPEELDLTQYVLQSGENSNVQATKNTLKLTSTVSGTPYTRVTYDLNEYFNKDYVLEADISFNSALENTRWMGIIVRDQEVGTTKYPFAQFDIRKNMGASNGIELTNFIGNAAYKYTYQGALPNGKVLDNNEKVKLAIAVRNNNAACYVNNNLAFTTTVTSDSFGNIGFQVCGCTVTFENVHVYLENSDYNFEATKSFSTADSSKSTINVAYPSASTMPNIMASGSNLSLLAVK